MPIIIQKNRGLELFAMIVDINQFAIMVKASEGNLIAQFVHDILCAGIASVENSGGEVVGFMGDAYFAVHNDPEKIFQCCNEIAKDVNKSCDYISRNSDSFQFSPKGFSLKIGIEYGYIDISEISSKFLGTQKLFIGDAINYAARIISTGRGNRCHVGPMAYENGLSSFVDDDNGPLKVSGKPGESDYEYYRMKLEKIWNEGESETLYWG